MQVKSLREAFVVDKAGAANKIFVFAYGKIEMRKFKNFLVSDRIRYGCLV